ncbi:MAG: Mth938-like domain-containing protein [Gammaproteobacteria bacterium]|jgi:uncharacterized protein|nr:Mth938-like domain-containing protein [Gammaproteobacteria bacterium]
MKIALDGAVGVNTIKAYEPGRVQIRDRHFSTSLIVLRDQLLADWQARSALALRAADLEPVLDKRPEVLILGTGETQVFPDPATFATLMDSGIGFEVMDNAAACRTYNVLVAEDRRAALALILPGGSD